MLEVRVIYRLQLLLKQVNSVLPNARIADISNNTILNPKCFIVIF